MRSPETTSSIRWTKRSCPTASGIIDSGKTTVSFSGKTGRVVGAVACRSTLPPHRDHDGLARGAGRRSAAGSQQPALVGGRRGPPVDVVCRARSGARTRRTRSRLLVDCPATRGPVRWPEIVSDRSSDGDGELRGLEPASSTTIDELVRIVVSKQSTAGRKPCRRPEKRAPARGRRRAPRSPLAGGRCRASPCWPGPTRPRTIRRMTLVRRIVKAAAAVLALGVYVWFAAVRSVGRVKRRKAARRASRRR